jgi:hypothetical protein
MFKSQVQILNSALSTQQKPTRTDEDFIIFKVEDLPCKFSTAIKAIGYKASANELYIQWRNNNETSRYFNVPETIWEQFRTCTSSLGKLYHQLIKGKFGSISCDNLID